MIRHIVFFSAKRREDVEAMRAGLSALAAIPYSSVFEVSLNTKVDPLSDEVDVVVYAEFADEAALAAYKAHPNLSRATRNVRPMRELRLSADVVAPKARPQRRAGEQPDRVAEPLDDPAMTRSRPGQQECAFPFAGDRILPAIGEHRLGRDIGAEALDDIGAIDAPVTMLLRFRKTPVAGHVLAERVGEGEVEQALRTWRCAAVR